VQVQSHHLHHVGLGWGCAGLLIVSTNQGFLLMFEGGHSVASWLRKA